MEPRLPTYGAAASVVVLLIWVYYSSQLVLMGAEFTRVYAKRRTVGNVSAVAPRPIQSSGHDVDHYVNAAVRRSPYAAAIMALLVGWLFGRTAISALGERVILCHGGAGPRIWGGTFLSTLGFTTELPEKGSAMATRTNVRTNVRSVVSDAQDKGREAVEAVSEVRDNVADAIDKSLKKRPYTTLGLTLALGFLLGVIWAR
jgi:ElaB/YqjD/DUF883 family membrane-anchored ribosome-binding protein